MEHPPLLPRTASGLRTTYLLTRTFKAYRLQ
jgi:hypothetical protein